MWNSELVSVVEHGGGVVTPTAYERERVAARESVSSVAEPLEQRKDYLFSHSSLTLRGGLGRSCSLVSLRVARAEGG